jgi:hypothetical protein
MEPRQRTGAVFHLCPIVISHLEIKITADGWKPKFDSDLCRMTDLCKKSLLTIFNMLMRCACVVDVCKLFLYTGRTGGRRIV